jgi:sugar O-acyltransferase (sialic acid O-acetyltransferase NeuD family)
VNAPLLIVGAGGHAAVLADALLAFGANVLGFTDIDVRRHGATMCGVNVLGSDEVLDGHDPARIRLVNGIGGVGRAGDTARRDLQLRLTARGWQFAGVQHPAATVSAFATIAAGVQILAGAIVQAGASLAEGCIVNTGAIVEHDTRVGAWSHVAPRAVLCGNVCVGAGSHVGAGAVVRDGVQLGAATIVGAGAVVVASHPEGATLLGVPARNVGRSA